MSEQQTKREPGASRKASRRQRIDVTLPQDVLDYLDAQAESRSRFLEKLVRAQMQQKGIMNFSDSAEIAENSSKTS